MLGTVDPGTSQNKKKLKFDHQSCNVWVDHTLERDPIDELLYRIELFRGSFERPLALDHEALLPEGRVEVLFAGLTESKPACEAHNRHFFGFQT